MFPVEGEGRGGRGAGGDRGKRSPRRGGRGKDDTGLPVERRKGGQWWGASGSPVVRLKPPRREESGQVVFGEGKGVGTTTRLTEEHGSG